MLQSAADELKKQQEKSEQMQQSAADELKKQ